MEILNSENLVITFRQDLSILTATWKESNMGEDSAKSEMTTMLEKIREFAPKYILVDSKKFKLRMNVELQRWINYTFMVEVVDIGVKKYAIVVDPELFEKLKSNEDPHDYDEESTVVQYFDNVLPAMDWLA